MDVRFPFRSYTFALLCIRSRSLYRNAIKTKTMNENVKSFSRPGKEKLLLYSNMESLCMLGLVYMVCY